jgi:hypothetical protein
MSLNLDYLRDQRLPELQQKKADLDQRIAQEEQRLRTDTGPSWDSGRELSQLKLQSSQTQNNIGIIQQQLQDAQQTAQGVSDSVPGDNSPPPAPTAAQALANIEDSGAITPPPALLPDWDVGYGNSDAALGFDTASGGPPGTDGAIQVMPKITVTASPIKQILFGTPNVLHNFASHTYAFSLALMTIPEYNQLVQEQPARFAPKNVILSSAGRRSQELNRNPAFDENFFIDDVKIETVIGLNSQTRGSNAVEISFTIFEPRGMTLYDRIIRVAQENEIKNHLEMAYLLILDFYGHTDEGIPTHLSDHTKYLPIKIVQVGATVKSGGSEYKVRAVPYNHVAFMMSSNGSTPVNMHISARTVGEFFVNGLDSTIASAFTNSKQQRDEAVTAAQQRENQIESLRGFATPEEANQLDQDVRREREAAADADKTFKTATFNAESYTQAMNAFELLAVEEKTKDFNTVYRFDIDEEIAQATVYSPQQQRNHRVPMTDRPSDQSSSTAQGSAPPCGTRTPPAGPAGASLPTQLENSNNYAVNAGTGVIDVINMVLQNSSYIRDQVKPEAASNKYVKAYKIIPRVEIVDYDTKTKKYSKIITFRIQKYEMFNDKSPEAAFNIPDTVLTRYQYIFTGKNLDVLDVNLEFNYLWYTMKTMQPGKSNRFNTGHNDTNSEQPQADAGNTSEFQPAQRTIVSNNMPGQTGVTGADDPEGIQAADFWNSLVSTAQGDMINVKLKILGDPRYIKQDDIFFQPTTTERTRLVDSKRNTVLFDYREMHVDLIFKTPGDYDDNTGLLAKNPEFEQSVFSGLYRIMRVTNTFQRGRFEQELDLIRLFEQEKQRRLDTQGVRGNANQTPAAAQGGSQSIGATPSIPSGAVELAANAPVEKSLTTAVDAAGVTVPAQVPQQVATTQSQLPTSTESSSGTVAGVAQESVVQPTTTLTSTVSAVEPYPPNEIDYWRDQQARRQQDLANTQTRIAAEENRVRTEQWPNTSRLHELKQTEKNIQNNINDINSRLTVTEQQQSLGERL